MGSQIIGRKACLIVIDGWGVHDDDEDNGLDAIRHAKTPHMDKLQSTFPSTQLYAHGLHVGLPDGLMGNSEVGHLNLGAGRVVYQDIVRIDLAKKSGDLYENEALKGVISRCQGNHSALHLIGLVSDGGVHSHLDHLKALLLDCKLNGIREVYVHAITDGRDVGPKTCTKYLHEIADFMTKEGIGKLASVVGRYYAMDRDKRWERTESAYRMFTEAKGLEFDSIDQLVESRYSLNETDEFFGPSILKRGYTNISPEDGIIFFNFRSDRMRQLVTCFLGRQVEISDQKFTVPIISSLQTRISSP